MRLFSRKGEFVDALIVGRSRNAFHSYVCNVVIHLYFH